MRPKAHPPRPRRKPKQLRARQTVEAVLDAVIRILKRESSAAVTTNRIAEVAGVSIGSVYQYFPDKRAIYASLQQRHIEEIDRLVEKTLVENATRPLPILVCAMIEAMVEAHAREPQFFHALQAQVARRADGTKDFAVRRHGAFRVAIASRAKEIKRGHDLDKITFMVTHMIDSLSHGVVLGRPPGLSLSDAKQEAVCAVLAYLRA